MSRSAARAALFALSLVTGAGGCAAAGTPDEIALERYYEANDWFERGRYEAAAEAYVDVIAVRDRLKDAYHKLAFCQEKLGRESEAVGTYERLLRVDRQDEIALRNLARLYEKRGRPEDALGALKALESRFPAVRSDIERLEAGGGDK